LARGDLSRKITVDVKGEILELKKHHQHDGGPAQRVRRRSDARGALRVGTEGKLGGQAQVPGVCRYLVRILTDTVNFMAANLTEQVRGIVKCGDRGRRRRPETEPDGEVEGRWSQRLPRPSTTY